MPERLDGVDGAIAATDGRAVPTEIAEEITDSRASTPAEIVDARRRRACSY